MKKKEKPRRRGEKLRVLSPLELEVMGVVWELGDCGSAEVIDAMAKVRSLAPTTVRTVLSKLREKGYVELIPTIERGYRFRAAVPRESVARRSLKDLLASLFRGSPREAIAYLLDDADMSDADFEEIRRMIESRRKG
jgi:BlaI family penicillinase repressor